MDYSKRTILFICLLLAVVTSNGQVAIQNKEINPVTPNYSIGSSDNMWLGTHSPDWFNSDNWSLGHVPLMTENVLIPESGNALKIENEKAYCYSLLINDFASLTIAPDASLLVAGDLVIKPNALLKLENAPKHYSALMVSGNVTGKATIDYPVVKRKSCLVSPPVSDSKSGVFMNMYLRTYDESSSGWGSYIVPTQVPLIPAQGYEVFSTYSDNRTFQGTPNFGDQSISVSDHADGWNLIGNPFPAYINWDWANDDRNSNSEIVSAVYYPDASGSGNYSVYLPGYPELSINNGSQYIPPMQGFFVKASKPGKLNFPSSICSATPDARNFSFPSNALKFKIASESYSDECIIRVDQSSTFAFDEQYDALKFPVDTQPMIYSSDAEERFYSINSFPLLSSGTKIPIRIYTPSNQLFTLTVQGALNFEYRYPVMLEDKVTGELIDLRKDSVYTFTHSPLQGSNRFNLLFDYSLGESETLKKPLLYCNSGQLYIQEINNEITSVDLYTLDGKNIYHAAGFTGTAVSIPPASLNTFIIARVTTNKQSYSYKLLAR